MAYYLEIRDNEIKGRCQCVCSGENVICIEVTEEIYNNYKKYIYSDGQIVINPDWDNIQLEKAKTDKITLNDELRDMALVSGVTYKDVLFDSDTDQKVNLLATVNILPDGDSIVWYGMDNKGLLCNKEDLMNIGYLITQLHTYCWTHNAEIKQAIEQATTLEELEGIEINYDEMDN